MKCYFFGLQAWGAPVQDERLRNRNVVRRFALVQKLEVVEFVVLALNGQE